MNKFIEKFRACENDNERLKLLRDTPFRDFIVMVDNDEVFVQIKDLEYEDEERLGLDENPLMFDEFGYNLIPIILNGFGIESEVV